MGKKETKLRNRGIWKERLEREKGKIGRMEKDNDEIINI
jgi:hypothetical protein